MDIYFSGIYEKLMYKKHKKITQKIKYSGFDDFFKPKYFELIFVIFIVTFMCVLAVLEFIKTFN